jgi:hypothetical protein
MAVCSLVLKETNLEHRGRFFSLWYQKLTFKVRKSFELMENCQGVNLSMRSGAIAPGNPLTNQF